MGGNQHLHMRRYPGSYMHRWCRPQWLKSCLRRARDLSVFSDMQTHTSRYFIKPPVIQNTQMGWQAATCVFQVLTDSSETARRWAARQKISCVFVSSRQASKQAGRQAGGQAGGEPERKSRAVGRQRYEASKSKGKKGRKATFSPPNHKFSCPHQYFHTQAF